MSNNISPTTHLKLLPEYAVCQRKTWYKLHSNTPQNETDSTARIIGILTHKIIENFLLFKKYGKFFDIESVVPNILIKEELKIPPENIKIAIEYFETAKKFMEEIPDFKIYFDPEVTFFLPYLSQDENIFNLKGSIDVIFTYTEDGKTKLAIGDWKTGHLKYENPHGFPQFDTYVYLFYRLYEPFEHVLLPSKIFIFGLKDKKIKTIKVTQDFINNVESNIERFLKMKKNPNIIDYPKTITPICKKWCEFSKDCIKVVMDNKI